jgi:hypothetical protein
MSVLSVSDVYPPTDPIRSDGEVMEMMRLLAGTETDQVSVSLCGASSGFCIVCGSRTQGVKARDPDWPDRR